MDAILKLIGNMNTFLWSYILIVMLITLGLYFTFRTKFVQFRYFGEMFRLLGDGASKDSKKEGKVSSFQAFCMSTASRVGTGNIAGIAIAIIGGGPGAIFWMWIIALIGSASSFVESTFNNAFGLDKMVIGIVLAALTAAVIFGGVHRVAKVSEIIVPIFAGLYILVSLFIVVTNLNYIPGVFKLIFESAFGMREIAMGTMGGMMLTGIKRGLFSNEAGMGSAPNAAATADVSHPVQQGLIQTLGVFTDTIVICSCTAFIILLYPTYMETGLTGIELTQAALSAHIGPIGNIFIAVCIFLFAFSSIVGNYYYGQSNMEFVNLSKTGLNVFRVIVVGMVLFGALTKVQIVWDLADVFMGLMAVINLVAITLLGKYAFAALDDYTKQKKAGIKNPIFNASNIKGLENVECWNDNKFSKEVI